VHHVISLSSMIYTVKDITLPVTNLERQENSCLKVLYHMKDISVMVIEIVNVIVFCFILKRSMIGNISSGHRTSHNTFITH
jgi:hypothetical protein